MAHFPRQLPLQTDTDTQTHTRSAPDSWWYTRWQTSWGDCWSWVGQWHRQLRKAFVWWGYCSCCSLWWFRWWYYLTSLLFILFAIRLYCWSLCRGGSQKQLRWFLWLSFGCFGLAKKIVSLWHLESHWKDRLIYMICSWSLLLGCFADCSWPMEAVMEATNWRKSPPPDRDSKWSHTYIDTADSTLTIIPSVVGEARIRFATRGIQQRLAYLRIIIGAGKAVSQALWSRINCSYNPEAE